MVNKHDTLKVRAVTIKIYICSIYA